MFLSKHSYYCYLNTKPYQILSCRNMSYLSDNLPNRGLEMDLSKTESNITGLEELVEVLNIEPLAMIPLEQFEQPPFLDVEMTDDDVTDKDEFDPESRTSKEEPSPLCRPPIIQIGALVYLKG